MIGPEIDTLLIRCFPAFWAVFCSPPPGCVKVWNLASAFASMVVCTVNGSVLFAVSIFAVICSIAGNMLAARFALKGGSKNVRKAMLIVLLFIKIGLDNLGLLTDSAGATPCARCCGSWLCQGGHSQEKGNPHEETLSTD